MWYNQRDFLQLGSDTIISWEFLCLFLTRREKASGNVTKYWLFTQATESLLFFLSHLNSEIPVRFK